MERRTEPGYEYHSCDFMDDGVYIDMNLLREYEDTGLAPEQIQELKERDTEKAPERAEEKPYFRKHFRIMTCLVCHRKIEEAWMFCPWCGQRMKKKED